MVNVLPHLLSLSPSVVYNMCICICAYAYIHTCIPGRTPSLKTMLNSLLLKPLKTFNKNRKQILYIYLPTEKIRHIIPINNLSVCILYINIKIRREN